MAQIFETETFNNVGAVAAAPTSGSIRAKVIREGAYFRVDLTLTAARVVVTDAAASGSHGTLPLFTFVEGAFAFLAARQNYTAFAEGAALTTAAGDAAFKIGVGTVAKAAAADGALAGATDDDIAGEIAITLSGGTGTGTLTGVLAVVTDGTAAAKSIHLNWSGSAATIDATSYIDVTGTISIAGVALSDD
jgi:hypothetical protein